MTKKPSDAAFEDTVYQWLRSMGIRINKYFLARELTTHADYPAIISLIDFLDLGGMKYSAIESSRQYIPQFKYPLLAHVKEENREYIVLVKSPADWENDKNLNTGWTGIVLFPEGNPGWQYDENTRQLRQNRAIGILAAGALVLLLAVMGYTLRNHFVSINFLGGLLSLAGLLLSMAIIATELGLDIKVVQGMCRAISPGGCDAVLQSRYAKGIGGMTIADLALSYFTTQLLFFLWSNHYPALFMTGQLLALPGIGIAVVSLYLQKFRLKRWCTLCLGIVSVLLLQGAIALWAFNALSESLTISSLASFVLIQSLLCAIWLPVRRGIKIIQRQFASAMELRKWKRDGTIFLRQWETMPYADTSPWTEEVQFGHHKAPLQITVACQPYCRPCKHAHEVLDNLYHTYRDLINIKVRFVCPPDQTDMLTLAVSAILRSATAIQHDDEMAKMLTDWFVFMNLEKWQQKWGTTNEINVDGLIDKHNAWIMDAQIQGTPTIFINGRQLPKMYAVEDLFALVPVLAESLPQESTAVFHHSNND